MDPTIFDVRALRDIVKTGFAKCLGWDADDVLFAGMPGLELGFDGALPVPLHDFLDARLATYFNFRNRCVTGELYSIIRQVLPNLFQKMFVTFTWRE